MIKEHQNKIGFKTPHMDLYDNKLEDKGTRDKRQTTTRPHWLVVNEGRWLLRWRTR